MKYRYNFLITAFACCLTSVSEAKTAVYDDDLLSWRSPVAQPYAYVSGGAFTGAGTAFSPDPLVDYVWQDPKADNPLQVFVARPVSAVALEGESNVSGLSTISTDACDINVNGDCVIRFDMGAELPAWIEMDSPDLYGDVEMAISEYNVPELINKTRKPVKYGNSYRLELNSELYEGVRYGFIYVRNCRSPFHITSVRAMTQVKPTNYTGRFDCDNPIINKIWYVGAWTVKVNLREDCFGAILLDRGDRFSWTGDAYPAQAASLVAFSNYDAVLKNLRWTESHPNNIESYEMYWVESLIDYYMYSGDEEGFRSLIPMAEKRLKHAWSIFDSPTNLEFFGWGERTGRGFDNPNIADNRVAYKMLAIGAWKHFAAALRTIGENDKADTYDKYARAKTKLFTQLPGNISSLEMHSSADAINADLISDLQRIYHPDFGDRLQRLSYSPFNEYMVINAMAKAGHYDDAFRAIMDEWGGQINYGATCFLEVFRPAWLDVTGKNGPIPYTQTGFTSLAHPWGAGVTAWLTREMLGIRPTSPGFRTFEVKPHFEGVATRVEGVADTPSGAIKASFNLVTGLNTLIVPAGTVATMAIPKEGMEITKLELNGKTLDSLTEDDGFVYIHNLAEGEHHVRAYYSGECKQLPEEDFEYAVTDIRTDYDTHGEWFRKYGKDGYFIVGGGADKQDLVSLPDYVESITFDFGRENINQHRSTIIKPIDERAMLPVSDEPGAQKAFGCYYSGSMQSVHMCPAEIRVKKNSPYTLAVYMADCDKGGRELLIDLFDLETGRMIAPTKKVKDFNGGVYFVFTYDRSVRILGGNLRGDNAVVNAFFFDNGPVNTSIANPVTAKDDGKLYTLSGISVDRHNTPGGIYIADGKKIVINARQ
ncbi:MAG: alpha-L-rhamnosidase C-terminal domain-containing protein [Prevotella sp.]